MLQDEAESDWKCQKAKDHTKPYLEVLDWFRQLERDTDELLNSVAKCDVKNCESFLASHRQKLHRYNMFMVRVKYSLCGMYGRTSGYAMQELKPADVMRKKLLCEELLEVLQKIDAGISVRRGKKRKSVASTFLSLLRFFFGHRHGDVRITPPADYARSIGPSIRITKSREGQKGIQEGTVVLKKVSAALTA